MLTKEELPECPVATTVQLVGSKWKLLILRNLLARPWRFNELRKDLEGISQKVLAHLGCHGAVGQRLQSQPGTGGGLHPGVKTARDVPARGPRFFFSRLTAPGKCGMMPPGKTAFLPKVFWVLIPLFGLDVRELF